MRVLTALLLVVAVVACQPAATTPSPTAAPTATAAETDTPEGWSCTLPAHRAATTDRAHIHDVRIGPRGSGKTGYDRIIFEFEGVGIPEVDLREGTPPFTKDPSGLPLDVAGTAWLVLVLRGGTAVTPEGRQTYDGPTEFAVNFPAVLEMKQAGDFEAVSEWVIGLRIPACHSISVREEPTRLLIDVQHPQN